MEELKKDLEEMAEEAVDFVKEMKAEEKPEEETAASDAAETAAETETVKLPETPADEPEIPAEPVESMDDYQDLLEASYRQIHVGDVMKGTVVHVDETGALLDLNYYAPGKIPVDEMSNDPHFSILDEVRIGDVMEATVTKRDDGAGNILLSRKDADDTLAWDRLRKLMDEKTPVSGKISEVTKSGAIFYVEGVRGFIPASKLDLTYVENTEEYLNKLITVQVISVEQETKRVVLSAKELLQEKAIAEKNRRISLLTPGNIVDGTVELIKDFGAFVKIGDGISGLLHISQISNTHVKNIRAVLKEGQSVRVLITKVENGKVSLSMKALEDTLNTEKAEEDPKEYSDSETASTSLGDLFKNLKF